MTKIIETKIDRLMTDCSLDFCEKPMLTKDDYKKRIDNLLSLSAQEDIDIVIVYADREHFSNMEYLSGYDPRFEEAILILGEGREPILIVGNEGWGYADIISYEFDKQLYPAFSLTGQTRQGDNKLKDLLIYSGIKPGQNVGIIGWKQFYKEDFCKEEYEHVFEVPHFIIQKISDIVGEKNIYNKSKYMIDNDIGLRHTLDAKEIICHEIAGTKASRNVMNVIRNLREGMTELEASKFLCIDGDPVATHPNINFGQRHVFYGLASPSSNKKLQLGDLVSVGMGYRGSLVHRSGVYAKSKKDLNTEQEKAIENYFKPYFQSVAAWYEYVKIGASGGEVFSAVKEALVDLDMFGVKINPGHQIHTEEWTNSLFFENSGYKIKSGMGIQCDIIACVKALSMHVEDGIVAADEELRKKVRELSPVSWKRISARKKFMKEVLNIKLSEDILPLSDIQAVCFPYLGDTSLLFSKY